MVNDGVKFSSLVSDKSARFITERLRGKHFRPYFLAVIIGAETRPGDYSRRVVGSLSSGP
jgi:hypothetical protein